MRPRLPNFAVRPKASLTHCPGKNGKTTRSSSDVAQAAKHLLLGYPVCWPHLKEYSSSYLV